MKKQKKPTRPARYNTFQSNYEIWRQKVERCDVGVDNRAGKWVIIYSCFGEPEISVLRRHSQRLADEWTKLRDDGRKVEIASNPTLDELRVIVADEKISSLAFIGHGSLGAVRRYEGRRWVNVPWYEFADMAGPLKQGVFEQRTCAMTGEGSQVRIPVGTFIMSDPRRIYAAVNHYFPDNAGFEDFQRHIHPVYDSDGSQEIHLLEPLTQ